MARGKVIDVKSAKQRGFIQKGKMDITFLALVVILLTIGLVMLFSASYAYAYEKYDNSYKFILRQAMFALFGLVVMFGLSKVDCHVYKKIAWPLYIGSLGVLALLLVLDPMIAGMDVKRWIVIGPINFQPSEIAKFAIILLFSSLISANYSKMKTFKFGIFFLGLLLAAPCILVILEPHLSATVLIFAIGIVLMIVGGIKAIYIFSGVGVVAGLGALVLFTDVVKYASSRIQYWLDPWSAPKGEGYQTIQSLLSIGSGGLLGRGLGQSRQKYLWVPEPHNDFIFSTICEELGFIGAMIIVLIFCLLVWRGFIIAMRSPDKYSALMAMGLVFQVGLQAALNIMVVTNTIPNTGISLPFFSYGGTSLVILLAEMGIVLSISRSSRVEKR